MKVNYTNLTLIADYQKQIEKLKKSIHFNRMEIINAFAVERKERQLSYRQAAKLLGVSAAYLHDLEIGRRGLSLNLLNKIKGF